MHLRIDPAGRARDHPSLLRHHLEPLRVPGRVARALRPERQRGVSARPGEATSARTPRPPVLDLRPPVCGVVDPRRRAVSADADRHRVPLARSGIARRHLCALRASVLLRRRVPRAGRVAAAPRHQSCLRGRPRRRGRGLPALHSGSGTLRGARSADRRRGAGRGCRRVLRGHPDAPSHRCGRRARSRRCPRAARPLAFSRRPVHQGGRAAVDVHEVELAFARGGVSRAAPRLGSLSQRQGPASVFVLHGHRRLRVDGNPGRAEARGRRVPAL